MTVGPEDLAGALAALHQQQNTARTYAQNLTPAQARNVTGLANAFPNLGPAVIPLGAAGVTPDHPVARKAALAAAQADSREVKAGQQATGGWMSRVWGGVKDKVLRPTVRYAAAGAQFPLEVVQGAVRGTLTDAGVGEGEHSGWGDIWRQTTIGAGVTEAARRGILDNPSRWDDLSGDGWFIGPQSKTGRAQARAARTAGLIDGHATTLGRATAHGVDAIPMGSAYLNHFYDQGGTGHRLLSGLVDGVFSVAADPTTYLGGAAAKGARARNVITAGPLTETTLATRTARGAEVTPVLRGGAGGVRVYHGTNTQFDKWTVQPSRFATNDKGQTLGDGIHFSTKRDYAEFMSRWEKGGDPHVKDASIIPTNPLHTDLSWQELTSGFVNKAKAAGHDAIVYKGTSGDGSTFDNYMVLDPSIIHTAETDRVFVAQAAGIVDGTRSTFLPEKAAAWLDSKDAGRVIEHIAAEKDFERLRRALGKKVDVKTLIRLQDADHPVDVKNIIADTLASGTVRDKLAFTPKRDTPPRIFGMVPAHKIDMDDMDDAVEQLDRFQRNANMSHEQITRNNEALARAGTYGERFDIIKATVNTVGDALRANGFTVTEAKKYTQMFDDAFADSRRYFVDATGDNAHIPAATIGGTGKPLPAPHLSTELINRYVPLPDPKDIRAATARLTVMRKLQAAGLYRGSRDFADWITGDVFKTMALATRPAWTVRVVGEEQVRMGAAGLASAFHHPLSYMAWLAGESESRLGKIMQALPGVEARGGTDVLGRSFSDNAVELNTPFRQAMNTESTGWRNRNYVHARHWTTYQRHEDPYVEAWHDELTQLATAPEANQVARHMDDLDSVKDAWWDGDPALSQIRRNMAAALPDAGYDTRAGSDAFIDSIADRIHIKTGGHPELLDMVAHGRLRGHDMVFGGKANPRVLAVLRQLEEEGVGPQVVKGPVSALIRKEHGGKALMEMYDRAAEAMFHALGAVPTNKLSRSPAFRQFYWQRVGEVAPMLTRQDRVLLARQAAEGGMDKGTVRALRDLAGSPTPEGRLTLAEVDDVAKAHALDKTRDLLYSLHEKSQAAEAVRVLFPFAEAWREVLTRWAKLGTENPLVPYRAAQLMQEGEGGTEGRDGILFHPDPLTGQEMISLPGTAWLSNKLAGVPVAAEMPVQGLNMFGNVLPGVGPVVTIPAGKLLPQNPRYDWVRDIIMPYGPTDLSGGVAEAFLPSYVKKTLAALGKSSPTNDRQLASTTRDVMAYLYSTGDYDLSTPEGQDRLIRTAKNKARAIYLIRGLAQSTLPASPSTRFAAQDKDGHLIGLFKLAEDYRRMQQADYTTATERFIRKYGPDSILAIVGKTQGSTAPTDVVNHLARSHPEVARKYPTTFGLFAPGGEVDPGEIQRQVEQGTRTLIGPEKAVATANIRIAASIYRQAQAQAGDKVDPEERAWLRDVKDRLRKDYPGYTGGFDTGAQTASVDELLRAGQDPVLADTRAGQALAIYVQGRQQAIDWAKERGLAWPTKAQAAAPIHQWLTSVSARIIADYPEFADMYDRVLSREIPEEQ